MRSDDTNDRVRLRVPGTVSKHAADRRHSRRWSRCRRDHSAAFLAQLSQRPVVRFHDYLRHPDEPTVDNPGPRLEAAIVPFASHLVEGDRLKIAAAAAAYPLGFIFVIMARSELFTAVQRH